MLATGDESLLILTKRLIACRPEHSVFVHTVFMLGVFRQTSTEIKDDDFVGGSKVETQRDK